MAYDSRYNTGPILASAANLNNGTTGTGAIVLQTSPTLVTPALGTPASGVATNLTGTAASLTAGTVTTNANLTGPITSTGNATAIASQTGTGTKFVVDTSPTLVTPALGVATATSIAIGGATIGSNGLAVTGHLLLEGATTTGATGTGNLVLSASPTFTSVPAAPTASVGTNTTQLATTAFVIANAPATVPTTTWTATDQSGGSLTFSNSGMTTYQIGKLVTVSFIIVWPSTADTHTVLIGGLPVAAYNNGGAGQFAALAANTGATTALGVIINSNAQTFTIMIPASLTSPTNVQMSAQQIRGTFTYIAN